MDAILQNNLNKAGKGRDFWIRIMETQGGAEGLYVILIPDGDIRDAYLSLLFLEDFIEEKGASGVLILANNPTVQEAAPFFCGKIKRIIPIDLEMEEAILKFYCLYEFSNRLVIASLSEPVGRRGAGLVQTGKLCYAEAFAVIVYGLAQCRRREAPTYEEAQAKALVYKVSPGDQLKPQWTEKVQEFILNASKTIWAIGREIRHGD